MKKSIFLAGLLFGIIADVRAQEAEHSVVFQNTLNDDFIRNNKEALSAIHPAKAKKARAVSRWYDLVDAIDKEQGGAGTIYNNYSYNYLWQDSTLLAPFGTPTTYNPIWIKSIIALLDPGDPRFNTAAAYPGEIAITRTVAYTIDSVFFPYLYYRNPSKPGIVDTLVVSVIRGNGNGSNNDLGNRYYGPTSPVSTNHLTDTLRYLPGYLDLDPNSPDFFTLKASAPANVVNFKIPLTAASENDTLTAGYPGFNYFELPVNLAMPAGYLPAISVTFKSGDTWVPYVDTVRISGAATPNFNYFRFVAFEENLGMYQTYIKKYFNHSGIMKNDTTGFSNRHLPSYGFTASSYSFEFFPFSWKATCATCGLTAVADATDETTQINIYPNPTTDKLNFFVQSSQDLDNTAVQLMSVDGKILYSEKTETIYAGIPFKKELNISGLAKGMYMLKVQSDKGVMSRKVVVE